MASAIFFLDLKGKVRFCNLLSSLYELPLTPRRCEFNKLISSCTGELVFRLFSPETIEEIYPCQPWRSFQCSFLMQRKKAQQFRHVSHTRESMSVDRFPLPYHKRSGVQWGLKTADMGGIGAYSTSTYGIIIYTYSHWRKETPMQLRSYCSSIG